MDTDDLAADRKTETETAPLGCEESVEEALLVGRRDSNAGVRDRDRDVIVCRR